METSSTEALISSVMTKEEDAAKLHIEEIKTQKFSIRSKDSNPLTLDLHYAVTSLSAELYQTDIHFLMELIQNTEANEYKDGVEPTLEFVLTKDITGSGASATLLVFNNEVGFTSGGVPISVLLFFYLLQFPFQFILAFNSSHILQNCEEPWILAR